MSILTPEHADTPRKVQDMETSIEAAQANLGKIVDAAVADGTTVVLTRNGTPVARIIPLDTELVTPHHIKTLFRHQGAERIALALDGDGRLQILSDNNAFAKGMEPILNSSEVKGYIGDQWSEPRAAQLAANCNDEL